MNIYRNDYRTEGYNSGGYSFHASKAAALKDARLVKASTALNEEPIERVEIELLAVSPTKAGILKALTLYASHPNNG